MASKQAYLIIQILECVNKIYIGEHLYYAIPNDDLRFVCLL